MLVTMSLRPMYRLTVVEIVTSTIVERMQMAARPAAFCFMRYIMPETAMKLLGL